MDFGPWLTLFNPPFNAAAVCVRGILIVRDVFEVAVDHRNVAGLRAGFGTGPGPGSATAPDMQAATPDKERRNAPPEEDTQRRYKQQKANSIGHETGGQQHGAGKQKAEPVKNLGQGHFAPRHGFLGPVHDRQALRAQQRRTDGGGDKYDRDRRPKADQAANLYKDANLNNGNGEK